MEVANEEILWMEKSSFGNVRLVVFIGPPMRPTQVAS